VILYAYGAAWPLVAGQLMKIAVLIVGVDGPWIVAFEDKRPKPARLPTSPAQMASLPLETRHSDR